MKPISLFYTCKNEDCAKEFTLLCHPYVPAKIYGPPENCHPEEGGEIEPEECPFCGQEIDIVQVELLLAEKDEDCGWED